MIFKKAVELEVLKKDPTEHTHVPKKLKTIEELEGKTDLPKYLEKPELKHFLQGVTGYIFNTLTSLLVEAEVSLPQIIERLGHKD